MTVTSRLHSSGFGIIYSDIESKSRIGSVCGCDGVGGAVVRVGMEDVCVCGEWVREVEVVTRFVKEEAVEEEGAEEVTKPSGTSYITFGP